MAPLRPLLQPTATRPASNFNGKIPFQTVLINNFQFSTWLLAAACVQGLLTWLFPTAFTFIPALLILLYRALDVFLIMYGFRSNPYMHDVIKQKFSAQVPDDDGSFGERPSRKTVVVLLLGSKSNHPLGILAPQFIEVGNVFTAMVKDLEENREEYGFITSTSWINNTDPNVNAAREGMTVFYFQSVEGLHKFAHGEIHRKGWDWWNRTIKQNDQISIMHEVWEAPAGSWENIYINYRPTGFAKGMFPINRDGAEKGETGSEKQWIGNIVDASKMNMKSSNNRLGRV
ncbi:hypothetical protein BJX99DRAFT_241603 [Aspergillus californicus]